MEKLKLGCILSPLHLVTLTVHVDKSAFKGALTRGKCLSSADHIMGLYFKFHAANLEQLELHVL